MSRQEMSNSSVIEYVIKLSLVNTIELHTRLFIGFHSAPLQHTYITLHYSTRLQSSTKYIINGDKYMEILLDSFTYLFVGLFYG